MARWAVDLQGQMARDGAKAGKSFSLRTVAEAESFEELFEPGESIWDSIDKSSLPNADELKNVTAFSVSLTRLAG